MSPHWDCADCDATGHGTAAEVDKAAAAHTRKARHATRTWTTDATIGWERP